MNENIRPVHRTATSSPLLTVLDVAARLNISRTVVYQLLGSGRIVGHRVGTGRGSIRITEEDLQHYLASCRTARIVQPPEPPRTKLKHLKL